MKKAELRNIIHQKTVWVYECDSCGGDAYQSEEAPYPWEQSDSSFGWVGHRQKGEFILCDKCFNRVVGIMGLRIAVTA